MTYQFKIKQESPFIGFLSAAGIVLLILKQFSFAIVAILFDAIIYLYYRLSRRSVTLTENKELIIPLPDGKTEVLHPPYQCQVYWNYAWHNFPDFESGGQIVRNIPVLNLVVIDNSRKRMLFYQNMRPWQSQPYDWNYQLDDIKESFGIEIKGVRKLHRLLTGK